MASDLLVVTGTDTGVGKTVVAAGLARAARTQGRSVVALKPVESGCAEARADEEDGARLARAAGQDEPRAALRRLGPALAPPLAAEADGVSIDLDDLLVRVRAHAADADVALVEAAGGLLAPLTWDATPLDLARRLDARTLVVAADRLGTINHVRLTLAALRGAAVPVTGLVLSAPSKADSSTGTNASSLARLPDVPPVTLLPRVAGVDEAAAALADLARRLWP